MTIYIYFKISYTVLKKHKHAVPQNTKYLTEMNWDKHASYV